MKKWLPFAIALFIIASTLLSFHQIINTADNLDYFGDEVSNDQAITSFLSTGKYVSIFFGLQYSSGVVVTWPAAVGWFLWKNLLAARLSSAFFTWLFSLALSFYFFRKEGCSRITSLLIATCLWAWTITSPFAMPYWMGFLHNLGELNSVLLIGLGLFILPRRLFLATFLFGLAVWQGKLIFLPFVGAILAGHLSTLKLPGKQLARTLFLCLLTFLSPFLLWVLWLSLRFGISTLKEWLYSQYHWINFMASYHEKVISHNLASGWERFTSPKMEWVRWSIGTKMKNLLLSLGAIGITLAGVLLSGKKSLAVSDRAKRISILLACIIGAHTIGHFFFHPFMWQRHFLPSLYIGFGLWVFWMTKLIKGLSFNIRPWLYITALLLLAAQMYQGSKFPTLSPQGSYARSCTNLYDSSCSPAQYQ